MVHIINGEIVPDDDPRVQRPPRAAAGARPPSADDDDAGPASAHDTAAARLFGAAPAAASRPTFDRLAAPLALDWGYTGPGGGGGLPAVRVFGAVAAPAAVAAFAAALTLGGLPAGALAVLTWVLWKLGGPSDPAPRAVGDVAFGGRLPAAAVSSYLSAAASARPAPPAAAEPSPDEVRAATRAAWAKRGE